MFSKSDIVAGCIKTILCIGGAQQVSEDGVEDWSHIIKHNNAELRSQIYGSIRRSGNGWEEELKTHFLTLQKFAENSQKYDVGEPITRELLLLSKEFYPENTPAWEGPYEWKGVKVFYSDEIFDLGRSDYHLPKFRTKLYQGIEIIETDLNEVVLPTYGESGARLKAGLAPIGEDGMSIRLCRIVNHNKAPLFEMNFIDSADMLNRVGANMSHNEACISEAATSDYWAQRYYDFYNQYNAEVK